MLVGDLRSSGGMRFFLRFDRAARDGRVMFSFLLPRSVAARISMSEGSSLRS